MGVRNGADGRRGLWRSRWAAIGAAVAITLGGGGWFVASAASSVPSSVVTIDPVRILDTRDPVNVGLPGPFVSAVSQKLQVAGTAGIPVGATGVLLNVTVVAPSADGFVSVRPGDATGAPSTSSLNFKAGDIVPNAVQVGLPTSGANAGQIDITYDAFGVAGPTTEVLVDVVGYMAAAGSSGGGGVDQGVLDRLSALDAKVAALEATTASQAATIAGQVATIAVLEAKTASMSTVTVEGHPVVRFSGVNVQVVDGSGDTAGVTNGRGNLIVGYHENDPAYARTGSHNLVVGVNNGYTSWAGVVFGTDNRISDRYATITGGLSNQATARYSTVTGGVFNQATGQSSAVTGGASNIASGFAATVTGGGATLNGGFSLSGNEAQGDYSTVTSGVNNTASGTQSSVTGGASNTASGPASSVTGGLGNTASGPASSVTGGLGNHASGSTSSVTGGVGNHASGNRSSVTGGDDIVCNPPNRAVCGEYDTSAAPGGWRPLD